jgi:class 3 adenylate cyclase
VAAYRQRGQALLDGSATLLAYDTLADGLQRFPDDVRLRQLMALALARSGATRLARQALDRLIREGHRDEETLGLMGRTHKDLSAEADDPEDRRLHLAAAFACYRDAYQTSAGIWSGINAATTALLLGDRSEAASLARLVHDECLRMNASGAHDDYWTLATLGEAALILGRQAEAEEWYGRAVAVGAKRVSDVASTRRNARLILQHVDLDGRRVEACLRVPSVAVFSGHMIDRPDRVRPRFPGALEDAVGAAIRERLRGRTVGFGYASAACGADILFLENLLAMNAEAHIVLPYDPELFLHDSVALVPGSDWVARFRHVLAAATEVITASTQRMAEGSVSYEYAFLLMDGAAGLRAQEFDAELLSLAVWDGEEGDGPWGTASTVAHWRAAGRTIEVINVNEMRAPRTHSDGTQASTPASQEPGAQSTLPGRSMRPEIVALLFADVRGFSRLTEEEMPPFVEHFLGAVAGALSASPHRPLLRNTWGDGLYFVFKGVRDAGLFALQLGESIGRTDWIAKGFSRQLTLRIGLHAGPAYACTDPVTGRLNYLGSHVSQAARIEPITPPGQVYASAAFAALAYAEGVRDFVCDYLGRTPLAKGYGTFPTYVVHRRHETTT